MKSLKVLTLTLSLTLLTEHAFASCPAVLSGNIISDFSAYQNFALAKLSKKGFTFPFDDKDAVYEIKIDLFKSPVQEGKTSVSIKIKKGQDLVMTTEANKVHGAWISIYPSLKNTLKLAIRNLRACGKGQ